MGNFEKIIIKKEGETTDNEERTGQGPKGDFREVLF